MTAPELAAWLSARGWSTELVSDVEVTAVSDRTQRRYLLANDARGGTLVGNDYWRIEHVRGPRRPG